MDGFVLLTYREVKKLCTHLLLGIGISALVVLGLTATDGTVVLENVQGDVKVRYGVEEEWEFASSEMTLRPEDSIKTGTYARAVIRLADGTRYDIPENTYIDIADLRKIDRSELLLRLALEDMLSVPERINEDKPIPQTTVLHGTRRWRETDDPLDQTEIERIVNLRLNGARFLVRYDFSETALLKVRETIRLYPVSENIYSAMWFAGELSESMQLYEEARRYYQALIDSNVESSIKQKAEARFNEIKDIVNGK